MILMNRVLRETNKEKEKEKEKRERKRLDCTKEG